MHQLIAVAIVVLAACGGSPAAKTCTPPECTSAMSSYAVEIVGNAGSTFPATELTAVSLDTTGVIALSLPPSAQVTGHVTSAGKPVPASVVFTRSSAIPGRPEVTYETSSSPGDGSYSIAIPPIVDSDSYDTYTVRVRPMDSATYPPQTVSNIIKGDTTIDIPLPAGDELIDFHGTLSNAVSVGVSQATVVLRDASSLADLSTTTTTAADGSFDVYISVGNASGADGVVLVAQQGTVATGLVTLTLPVSATQVAQSTSVNAMALTLPALPTTTHLSIPVVGTSSSGTVVPVVGATFRVYAPLVGAYTVGQSVTGQSVLHEVDGQTDANGEIQADLFSGSSGARTYYVTLVPPSDSSFQTTSTPIAISVGSASGVVAPLTLASRPIVSGTVYGPAGTALANATVQPALSTIVSTTTSLTSSTSASATTDSSGRFKLYVDPNTYDLALSPPATASLPRLWFSRQVITGNEDVGSVQLPSAVMYDVLLQDSSSMPVQATVRLYVLTSTDPDCGADMGTCVAAPQLQAEVATDDKGAATMLLPAKAMSDLGATD